MDYNAMIDKIMPLVNSGDSSVPFIISRFKGRWEIDYLNTSPENAVNYLTSVRGYDPFAVQFTGADFDGGSYPFVYDKVLAARLDAEYNANKFDFGSIGEYYALVTLLNEHMGELSSDVTEFIAARDKPLVAIFDMLPISLIVEGKTYDESKVDDVIEIIESQVERLNKIGEHQKKDGVIMKNEEQSSKHIIEGYEERAKLQLAGQIVILAEKRGADDPYMVANCRWDNPLGADEYYNAVVTDNYLEAVREFVKREAMTLDFLEAQRSLSGLPVQTLTAADCIPDSRNDDYNGKVVVIKPEIVSPEYRSAEHQLALVTGGNGANPDARGRAVFVTKLYSGESSRYNRQDVAGVISPHRMPEWAKVKIAELQAGKETPPAALDSTIKPTPKAKIATKKPTLQDKLDAAKETARKAAAHNDAHGGKPKKRGDMEVD